MRPDNRLALIDLAAQLFIYVVLGAIVFGVITQSVVIGVLMFVLLYAAPMLIGYLWLKRSEPSPERIAEIERLIAEYDAQKAEVSRD